MNLARVEEVLIGLRYRVAPNAEQKINESARARVRETGEPIERARIDIIHERPDLCEDCGGVPASGNYGTRLVPGTTLYDAPQSGHVRRNSQ
jgi:hypothetical protein